jgi:hypothetical protein
MFFDLNIPDFRALISHCSQAEGVVNFRQIHARCNSSTAPTWQEPPKRKTDV